MEQNKNYPSVSKLIELARSVKMTEDQKNEQRSSFVYGNVAIEDETHSITREMVNVRAKLISHS